MVTYLLNNNEFSNPLALLWEKDAFTKHLNDVNNVFDGNTLKPISEKDTPLQKEIKQVYARIQTFSRLKWHLWLKEQFLMI